MGRDQLAIELTNEEKESKLVVVRRKMEVSFRKRCKKGDGKSTLCLF